MKQYTCITLLLTFFTIPTLSACNSRNLDKSTETALPYETSIETSENNFTTMDTTIISEENEKNENCRFPLSARFGAACTIEGRFERLKMDTYLLKIG